MSNVIDVYGQYATGYFKGFFKQEILEEYIAIRKAFPELNFHTIARIKSMDATLEKASRKGIENIYDIHGIKHIIIDSGENESILFLNEPYSSTNEINAIEQMNHLFNLARKRGLTVFVVTHFEIEKGQSYLVMSPIVDQNGKRTYKFERRLSAGASMCADILKRYKCDYESLMQIVESKKW